MENASKALIMAGAILIAILLISVGLILVNSGEGVTESGVTAAETVKIQTFNSQFTIYEGKRKGSAVKEIFSKVQASNAADPEHQVNIVGPYASDHSSISSTGIYTVELSYADSSQGYNGAPTEKGYIFVIYIH